MKHLFSEWETLRGRVSNMPLALFLDYDGTLTPIVSSPEKAVLDAKTRTAVAELVRVKGCRVAVISGRSLEDIKQRLAVEGIVYAGNHGLDIEGPKLRHTIDVGKNYLQVLAEIKEELEPVIADFPGSFVEDKGLSLSVHYRKVQPDRAVEFRIRVRELLVPQAAGGRIRVKPGKMVIEVRPTVAWDKGKVVLWLLARWQALAGFEKALPIYVGDDVTDEDAFRALGRKGLTVAVGSRRESKAEYYLDSTDETVQFLRRIVELKGKPL